jgi:hypothetical protein
MQELRRRGWFKRFVALLTFHSDSWSGWCGSGGAWGRCREDHWVGHIATTALCGGAAVISFAVACTGVLAVTTVVAILVL